MSAEEIGRGFVKSLQVNGTLEQGSRTDYGAYQNTTFQQWTPKLEIRNGTKAPITLGPDMFLFEANRDGTSYEGVAVFLNDEEGEDADRTVTSLSSYGLVYNYESGSVRVTRAGGNITFSFIGEASSSFGSIPAGETWKHERTLEQGTWLVDELRERMLLALPELQVKTVEGVERYRLVLHFAKPTGAESSLWTLARHEMIPVRFEDLDKLLAAAQPDQVLKVLAVNWLAGSGATQAGPRIVEVAQPLREGQVLFACLELLIAMKQTGLEAHARDLLEDDKVPNGVRNRAAYYLGAVKHAAALDLLIARARDEDTVVAEGAILGLGVSQDPKAEQALLTLLRDESHALHAQIAGALAKLGTAAAFQGLQDAARGGDQASLEALASAEAPQAFDFFASLARGGDSKHPIAQVAKGLRTSGKEKAIPQLIEMLARYAPRASGNADGSETVGDYEASQAANAVVQELTALDSPQATPPLVELAQKGNLSAVEVLAGSKNDSVLQPLTDLARKGSPEQAAAALRGLSQNWAEKSLAVFQEFLGHADAEIVRTAIGGIRGSQQSEGVSLLLPLIEGPREELRAEAAYALENLPLGTHQEKVLEIVLRTDGSNLAASLVTALVNSGWKDRSTIDRIAQRLRTAQGDARFASIRLLRHLSDDAMGPVSIWEFQEDADNWVRKWGDWADKQ